MYVSAAWQIKSGFNVETSTVELQFAATCTSVDFNAERETDGRGRAPIVPVWLLSSLVLWELHMSGAQQAVRMAA